jgi:tetratricopeptide (TPR) repeat protein
VQLKKDSAEAWNDLGVAQFAQKRPEEAVLSFERAVRVNPDYQEARRNLEAARQRLATGDK